VRRGFIVPHGGLQPLFAGFFQNCRGTWQGACGAGDLAPECRGFARVAVVGAWQIGRGRVAMWGQFGSGRR